MNWYRKILAATHSYSTVMLEFDGNVRNEISDFINSIDEDDIAEEGKEDNPHVTVLYGLHTGSAEEIKRFLSEEKSFEITLGKISKFRTSDEHDVLKIDIESESLKDMNKKLKELPYTSKYSTYRPHATIAYVKKGACEELVGSDHFEGKSFMVTKLVFSSKNEDKTSFSLGV